MTTDPTTRIGIIGAGNIGQAFARLAGRAGRAAVISHSGDPETLSPVARGIGAHVQPDTTAAAATAPIVVLAVPWRAVPDALAGLSWSGQIVVDATNAATVTLNGGVPTFTPVDLDGKTSSEVVAGLVPGARVVKAGNTLPAEVLAADPREADGSRVLFLSGDDDAAKREVATLFTDAGYSAIDLGGLAAGGILQQVVVGPLSGVNLVRLP